MESSEENKKLVERASFKVFNEGNVEILEEVLADEFVLHDSTSPEEIRGREAFEEYIRTYRNAFPDLDATIDSIVAEGDLVAARFTVRGTHEGPLPEAPDLKPTGTEIEISGMEFDRIENNRLAETWQAIDVYSLLGQLGVIPTDESSTEL